MRIRIKRRFVLICACLILIIAGITGIKGVAKNSKIFNKKLQKSATTVSTKKNPYTKVPIASDGSITVTENSFFKKYTISCTKDFDTVKYDSNGGALYLYFNTGDVNKISLNSTSEDKDIFSKKTKDEDTIMFKTNYDKNNMVYVQQKDKKRIDVLISKVEEPLVYKVVLDAGHGGTDPGTFKGELLEKNITLSIVKYMKEYLTYKGCNVIYTREKDELLVPGMTTNSIKQDLLARTDVANKINADAFVSVHINNNELASCKGVTTFYYTGTEGQEKERKALADNIQKNALISDNWYDMKVKTNNYSVLVHTNVPSALIECGFLTNPDDAAKLAKDEVLKNFAENISNGIGDFLSSDVFQQYKKAKDASK